MEDDSMADLISVGVTVMLVALGCLYVHVCAGF